MRKIHQSATSQTYVYAKYSRRSPLLEDNCSASSKIFGQFPSSRHPAMSDSTRLFLMFLLDIEIVVVRLKKRIYQPCTTVFVVDSTEISLRSVQRRDPLQGSFFSFLQWRSEDVAQN